MATPLSPSPASNLDLSGLGDSSLDSVISLQRDKSPLARLVAKLSAHQIAQISSNLIQSASKAILGSNSAIPLKLGNFSSTWQIFSRRFQLKSIQISSNRPSWRPWQSINQISTYLSSAISPSKSNLFTLLLAVHAVLGVGLLLLERRSKILPTAPCSNMKLRLFELNCILCHALDVHAKSVTI